MLSYEKCLEQADELAQEVVNAWGVNTSTGHAADLTADFKALLEKACQYRTAKQTADNRRQHNILLSEREAAEEKVTRESFATAYRDFSEKHEPSRAGTRV